MKFIPFFILAIFFSLGLFGQASLTLVPLRGDVYFIKDASLFQGNVVVLKDSLGGLAVDGQGRLEKPPLIDSMLEWRLFPIKYVINTHWHIDHSKGNRAFKEKGAKIVAHPNAYLRMKTGQTIEHFNTPVKPYAENELPDTLVQTTTAFMIGQETVSILSPGAAHTDGDLIIHFRNANVIHAGDILLSSFYPFPELSSGGSVEGLLKAMQLIIDKSDSETIILPGHGPMMSQAEVKAYRDMLADVSKKVLENIQQKKSLKDIQDLHLTKPYASKWNTAVLSSSQFIEMIHKDHTTSRRQSP